jgi:hypothetical protein
MSPSRDGRRGAAEAAEEGVFVASYGIRVTGRLSSGLLTAFPGLRARCEPVQTMLVGWLPDQSALTGVLDHLDELGVEIVEVIRLPDVDPAPADVQRTVAADPLLPRPTSS